MNIRNISFETDGKTIGVPPTDKAKGKLGLATKKDKEEHEEDYMLLCVAEPNKARNKKTTEMEH